MIPDVAVQKPAPPKPAEVALFARELYQTYTSFPFLTGKFSDLLETKAINPAVVACAGLNDIVIHDWVQHCLFGRCPNDAADQVPSFCLTDRRDEFRVKDLRSLVKLNAADFRKWSTTKTLDMRAELKKTDSIQRFSEITPDEMGSLVGLHESLEKSGRFKPSSLKAEWKSETKQVWEKLIQRGSGRDIFTAECDVAKAPWVQAYLESLLAGKEPPKAYSEQVNSHLAELNHQYETNPGQFENRSPQQIADLKARFVGVMERAAGTAGQVIARYTAPGSKEALAQQLSQFRQADLKKIKADFEQEANPEPDRIKNVDLAIANPSPDPAPIPRKFWSQVFGRGSKNTEAPEIDYYIRKPHPKDF